MGKEKEIFRECFNVLTANVNSTDWDSIAKCYPAILSKYKGNDNVLATELLTVIAQHLERIERDGKVE